MKKEAILKNFYQSCERLAEEFVKTYYNDSADYYWVADHIGGVFSINDHYWDIDTIIRALVINCSQDKLFEWYDKNTEEENPGSLEFYLKKNP